MCQQDRAEHNHNAIQQVHKGKGQAQGGRGKAVRCTQADQSETSAAATWEQFSSQEIDKAYCFGHTRKQIGICPNGKVTEWQGDTDKENCQWVKSRKEQQGCGKNKLSGNSKGDSRQALERDHANMHVRRADHLQTAGPGAGAAGQWAPALLHSTPAAHAPAHDTGGSDVYAHGILSTTMTGGHVA